MACCTIPPGQELQNIPPAGKIIRVSSDIDTYVTFPPVEKPSSKSGHPKYSTAILLLSDAHGIDLPSTQTTADKFATTLNCPVIVPDQFDGEPHPLVKPPGFDNEAAMRELPIKHNPSVVEPVLEKVLDWISRPVEEGGLGGVKRLGGVGYCFGARFIIRLLSRNLLAAGVINHPSFQTREEVQSLSRGAPLAIFAAETDEIFTEERRRVMEDILKANGVRWMQTVFGGVEHGFSIRGDESIPEVRFAKRQAYEGTVKWFEEFLH